MLLGETPAANGEQSPAELPLKSAGQCRHRQKHSLSDKQEKNVAISSPHTRLPASVISANDVNVLKAE